jgi:hypothetical protein
MHLVQIHGFCFIIEFVTLILLVCYVFDYCFNLFIIILLSKSIGMLLFTLYFNKPLSKLWSGWIQACYYLFFVNS